MKRVNSLTGGCRHRGGNALAATRRRDPSAAAWPPRLRREGNPVFRRVLRSPCDTRSEGAVAGHSRSVSSPPPSPLSILTTTPVSASTTMDRGISGSSVVPGRQTGNEPGRPTVVRHLLNGPGRIYPIQHRIQKIPAEQHSCRAGHRETPCGLKRGCLLHDHDAFTVVDQARRPVQLPDGASSVMAGKAVGPRAENERCDSLPTHHPPGLGAIRFTPQCHLRLNRNSRTVLDEIYQIGPCRHGGHVTVFSSPWILQGTYLDSSPALGSRRPTRSRHALKTPPCT
jgi:hypothetical protein